MPKTFYTERDIEDMAARGVLSLQVNDDVVLTELAYERAERLGVRLQQDNEKPPAAPERPYLNQKSSSAAAPAPKTTTVDVKQRIRDAVMARLGGQFDAAFLDAVIARVLDKTGVK